MIALTTAVVAASLLLFLGQHQSLLHPLRGGHRHGHRQLSLLVNDPKSTQHKTAAALRNNANNAAADDLRFGPDEFPYPLTCDKDALSAFLHNANLIDIKTGEKKIAINLVYHIGMVGNWRDVVTDQFNSLIKCGLLDAADNLYLTYSNGDGLWPVQDLLYQLLGDNLHKVKSIEESTQMPWEAPAMNMMLRHCNSSPSPKEEVVFYFHNKGTSRWSEDWKSKMDVPESYAYSLYWRKYLEYFTIERPQLCLEQLLLGGATSCGPNWRPGNMDNFKGGKVPKGKHLITNHYSGNFWSATCEHINHLEPMTGEMWYTDGELWIGKWEGVQAKLTTHFKRLYSNLILPEEYAITN
jgi:hypothetical protein